jgi:hypothetical protein
VTITVAAGAGKAHAAEPLGKLAAAPVNVPPVPSKPEFSIIIDKQCPTGGYGLFTPFSAEIGIKKVRPILYSISENGSYIDRVSCRHFKFDCHSGKNVDTQIIDPVLSLGSPPPAASRFTIIQPFCDKGESRSCLLSIFT